MIEKDILEYLQADTSLVTSLGGVSKIAVSEVKPGTVMPYLVIEASGGTRDKITFNKIEERNSIRITLYCAPDKFLLGRTSMERAKYLVENYRGDMGGADDMLITCSAVSGWASYQGGVYIFQFTARVRFTETLTRPL